MPTSALVIQRLIDAFPDASDDFIRGMARAGGMVKKAWDVGNKPLLNLGSESVKNPYGKFGLQMAEGLSSPLGIATGLLSGGSAFAGRAGLMGLAKGGLAAEAALSAPYVAQGLSQAATGESLGERGAGLLQAGLGGLGVRSPVKGLQRLAAAKKSIPDILAAAREYGGASIDPYKGNLAGTHGSAVGGTIVPERVYTGTSLQEFSPAQLEQFMEANARPLNRADTFAGPWEKEGSTIMDVTRRVPTSDAFRAGIRAGENSIFDLKNMRELPIRALPQKTRDIILQTGPIGKRPRPTAMLPLRPGDEAAGSAVQGLPRLMTDEAGKIGLDIGMGPGGRNLLEEVDALRKQAGEYGKLYPSQAGLARKIRSGDIGPSGKLSTVPLPELVPGMTQADRRALNKIVEVGPRKGAELSPFTQSRLNALMEYANKNLAPEAYDWTNPEWMKAFSSPQAAREFARVFGALSPMVELKPNMRDAVNVGFQKRMGIAPENMFSPFGHESTGFNIGLPKTKLPNLRKALRSLDEPIGSALPAKTQHLTEGIMGDPNAFPWDMHISRAMGIDSDAPGTPVQYLLAQLAYKKFAESQGIKTFPHMAKAWTAQKHATAQPAAGFVELLRRIKKEEPDFLTKFTPRNETEFFEALNRVNQLIGGKEQSLSFLNPKFF